MNVMYGHGSTVLNNDEYDARIFFTTKENLMTVRVLEIG